MRPEPAFWTGRRVLVTGHTGFKGGWLTLWLARMGAQVRGIALPPPAGPSLFEAARLGALCDSRFADIRDPAALGAALEGCAPEVVFHCAAQPLVRLSYADPVGTWMTNVMGTIHLLEALRKAQSLAAVVTVTSDKCYDNREAGRAFKEDDPLGGLDPYSSSKAGTEIAVASWRHSFYRGASATLATVRAGNVIGGGDWAGDRLVPDLLAGFASGASVAIRHPDAVRPWQHVLEPLCGYLLLAERMATQGAAFGGAWNFGPDESKVTVAMLAERMRLASGPAALWHCDGGKHPHEARLLALDSGKARTRLGWRPCMDVDAALETTLAWDHAWRAGTDMRAFTEGQIGDYCARCGPSVPALQS